MVFHNDKSLVQPKFQQPEPSTRYYFNLPDLNFWLTDPGIALPDPQTFIRDNMLITEALN